MVASHDSSYPRIVYDHARTEKEARGVAYTRAKRVLKRDSIVILDGMNYIKGWRYQLWCEAKAAQTTCCVVCNWDIKGALISLTKLKVHVGTPVDQCVANNDARLHRAASEGQTTAPDSETSITSDTEEAYSSELLNNLIFRYEEPSTHSRWDKPLFTVPYEDPEPPISDIFEALTGVVLATEKPKLPSLTTLAPAISDTASTTTGGPKGSRLSTRPRIVPHQSTVQSAATDPDAMYAMEKRTSAVVTAIRQFTTTYPTADIALAQSKIANGVVIPVPDVAISVLVPSHVVLSGTTEELAGAGGVLALPRLQRLRRQWISLNRAYNSHGSGGLTTEQIGDAFVRFLNAEFSGTVGALEE